MGKPPVVHHFRPQTADGLPVELQRLDARHVLHRMGLHGHSFFELIFIDAGGGPHRVGADLYPTRRGQLFILPPGEVHDCSHLGPATEGWVLLLTHEELDGLLATSRAHASIRPSRHPLLAPFFALGRSGQRVIDVGPDAERWSQRFANLDAEFRDAKPGYRHAIQAHLSLTLLDLVRATSQPAAIQSPDVAEPLLQDALAFIEDKHRGPITTQDVARAVDRSVAHLTTAMRRRTGLTVGDWILECRMATGRRFLITTALTLDAIADETGYSGADAFSRAFRRSHRLSPEAWRRAHRNMPPYI